MLAQQLQLSVSGLPPTMAISIVAECMSINLMLQNSALTTGPLHLQARHQVDPRGMRPMRCLAKDVQPPPGGLHMQMTLAQTIAPNIVSAVCLRPARDRSSMCMILHDKSDPLYVYVRDQLFVMALAEVVRAL